MKTLQDEVQNVVCCKMCHGKFSTYWEVVYNTDLDQWIVILAKNLLFDIYCRRCAEIVESNRTGE